MPGTRSRSLFNETSRAALFQQVELVFVHAINLVSNVLGNDFASGVLRKKLFGLLGARFGPGTTVRGGGYVYGGNLVTGSRCFLGRGCYFDFTGPITLGDDVVVGHGVTFITAEHRIEASTRRAGPASGRPIVVGNGAWLGANSTILPGVTIGEGAIVAAAAVVAKDVPPNVLVAGTPARVVKELEADPRAAHRGENREE